ncbi:MAG: cytochrome c [Planctomycetes bacterium]|nr:cytochrome c [Planctomycetota bacterium]
MISHHPLRFVLLLAACAGETESKNNSSMDSSSLISATVEEEPLVEEVYVANCALCHGLTGDGKGTVPLDRPARSFLEGGFSFGNTHEAVFRTITHGIGGTPMPPFGDSLAESTRHELADYVLAFNPQREAATTQEMILEVIDRPVVVRGHLPSITEGTPLRPRGLLLGGLDGLTWEYDAETVQLLGVRRGGFVERTDWGGRGGTPLKPLGELIWLHQGGSPQGVWRLESSGTPLFLKLKGTRIENSAAIITAAVHDQELGLLGSLEMWGEGAEIQGKPGLRRHYRFLSPERSGVLRYQGGTVSFTQGVPATFSWGWSLDS